MDNLTECDGHKEFDWSQETIMTLLDAASAGDPEAKKELAKREKQLGITSVATLSGNTQETSVFNG